MKRYRVFEIESLKSGHEIKITDTYKGEFVTLPTSKLNPNSPFFDEPLTTALLYVHNRNINVIGTAYGKEKIYLISEDFERTLINEKGA